MFQLDLSNVASYLASHYPAFDQSQGIQVQSVGDLSHTLSEEEACGFVNHLFRGKNATESIIIKQGQAAMRMDPRVTLPSDRNLRECESFRLRSSISPHYVPEIYYQDRENAIFIMEDVSRLGSVRYQLCQSIPVPDLGKRVGEFLGKNAFYTSELYLEADQFRRLSAHFRNSELRAIMEDWVFLRLIGNQEGDTPLSPHSKHLRQVVEENERVRSRTYTMRHKYMTQAECFIHGDLHVSNLFANGKEMKVLDMEYTFAGPYCYDVGYFLSSLLDSFCSACFRPFPSEGERENFIRYLVQEFSSVYHSFVQAFTASWQRDAKEVYRGEDQFRQSIIQGFLPDILSYSAIPALNQARFAVIQDYQMLRGQAMMGAQELCTLLGHHLLLCSEHYRDMDQALVDLLALSRDYQKRRG